MSFNRLTTSNSQIYLHKIFDEEWLGWIKENIQWDICSDYERQSECEIIYLDIWW